jgi:glycosyltransferase involved in cell wall biosynthesis
MSVSVLILTRNEEANLPRCLDSLHWSDDIVVFDSFSTDRTVAIAQAARARVFQREFDDYGAQREAARKGIAFRHPWVLVVDADECVDDELRAEVLALSANPLDSLCNAYRVRRKDHFMGKWIRHSTLYPSWFVRLVRPDRVRYEPRAVHEYPTVEGPTGELRGHLLHYSFNRGLAEWFAKHTQYAALEARENILHIESATVDWGGLIALDPVRRRRALKHLSFRIPLRPLVRFLYMYFVRGGVLDGHAGLTYCTLLAIYEYLIVLSIREQRMQASGRSG